MLVVAGAGAETRRRAETLAQALRDGGMRVLVARPRAALSRAVRRRTGLACVVTTDGGLAAHVVGAAARRAGVPWIADQPRPWSVGGSWHGRVRSRLLRTADLATSSDPEALRELHEVVFATAVALDPTGTDLERLVRVAGARREPARGLRVLVIGPTNSPHVEDFALALRERGVEVFVAGLPWGGGLGPSALPSAGVPVTTATWPAALWVRRLRRELQPTAVHAHWLPNAVAAALGGARPLVATAWGSDVYLASRRRRRGYRWLVRRADAMLADSSDLLDALRRLGAPPERTQVFHWGVDRSVFSPQSRPREELRRSLGLGPGPVVLSPRGLTAIYNPELVVAAFEWLAEECEDLQLVLKHNSRDEPSLPPLRFPERVRVVGPQPREQLADWFRATSVCVSLPRSDSSPRSVWEAMACGCPCVLSDLPWAREELVPGEHALLVPAEAEAAAAAIGRLLDDRELAGKIAAAAHAHVEAHHDRDKEMSRTIELYRKLAGVA